MCVRFRDSALALATRETACLVRGGIAKPSAVFLFRGLMCLIICLTEKLEGTAVRCRARENVGRGGVRFRLVERSELDSVEKRFAPENGLDRDCEALKNPC